MFQSFDTRKKAMENWHILAAIAILLLAFWVRSFPARFGELQGLDDFYMYRLSEYVLTHNFKLPDIDMMRNAPYGTHPESNDAPMPFYVPAYIYSMISAIGLNLDYLEWALLWPAIGGAIAVFIFFFAAKELFRSRLAAVIASVIIATTAAFINRTAAGNFEKEATAVIFWMLALYFFIRSYRDSDWRRSMIYGGFGGLNIVLMHLTWGGADFILLILTFFTFILAIINKATREFAAGFTAFTVSVIAISSLTRFYISPTETIGLFAVATSAVLVIRHIAGQYGLVKRDYLPYVAVGIVVAGTLLLSVLGLFVEVPNPLLKVLSLLDYGASVELSTVAESQPGSLDDIVSRNSLPFARNSLPQLDFVLPLASPVFLAACGLILSAYMILRKREMLLLLPIIALVASVYSVLLFVRLMIFVGPIVALLGGFSLAWVLKALYSRLTEAHECKNITFFSAAIVAGIASYFIITYLGEISLQSVTPIIASFYYAAYVVAFYFAFRGRTESGHIILLAGVQIMLAAFLWFGGKIAEILSVKGSLSILLSPISAALSTISGPISLIFSPLLFAAIFAIYRAYKEKSIDVGRPWLVTGIIVLILAGIGWVFAGQNSIFVLPVFATVSLAAYMFVFSEKRHANFFIVLSAFMLSTLVIAANVANGYTYGHLEGPSVCLPGLLKPGEKCIAIDEKGEYIFAKNQPWYEAFEFMANETSPTSNFLSWWDFGYWFQTRGLRPSVTDGGWGFRKEVADWFTAPASQWGNFTWLKERNVSHIFMDYTLPGKYGAISKIASGGSEILGMMQFQRTNQFVRDNTTVIEFSAGPFGDGFYRHIWLPVTPTGFKGPIRFLASKSDGQYIPQGTIADVCTNSGIIKASNETSNGCIALSDIGVFLIPSQAEDTVFSSLMFMDGYGLPVEKVFDSSSIPGAFPKGAIKIYRVLNEAGNSSIS